MRRLAAFPRIQLIAAIISLALLAIAALLAAAPARAQADAKSPDAKSADVQFSQQLDALKKSFADVSRQIDESAKSIDSIKSPEEGRKSIEELRAQVAKLLSAVADNGEVSALGVKALALAEEKLKSLERETRFKPEERQYLVNRWRELRTATETAIRDLDGARKDFAELLRSLQTSEDYIDELLQIREHEKALQVIHQLSEGIRDASTKLKKLLGSIKPPGV
jgi:DNA repair exonuclease SbcCD ATPase subunit